MGLPASLSPPLTTREAIADCLYRMVLSFDTADQALHDSSFVENGTLDFNGQRLEGKAAFQPIFDHVGLNLDTTHFLSNIRVHVPGGESAKEAQVTASALAQHYRPGEGLTGDGDKRGYLAASLYEADVVKDDSDGLWKMKHLKFKAIWKEGDRGVMGRG